MECTMIFLVSLLACPSKTESDSAVQNTDTGEAIVEDTANMDSGIVETDDTGEAEDSASDSGTTGRLSNLVSSTDSSIPARP